MAYIPKYNSYRDIVTVNSEGHMEMERTDFYDSIGLNYVEFRLEFTITKEHEIAEVALYTALGMAIGSEISSSINITNKVGAALGGLTSNIISGEIQSGLVLEAGNYVSEIILCDRPMEGNRNMYENVETVRVLKYATDINTGENVPIEIISDYRTRYTGMTEGSEVNKIKNEIKM